MKSIRPPTYKRQQLLLLMLQEVGGKLSRTDFQKLLFLLSREQEEPPFDFVPYRYGCFSYQAMADLDTLQHQGWVILNDKTVSLVPDVRVRTALSTNEITLLVKSLRTYEELRGRKLIRHVYEHFPYFAVNSEIVEDVLDEAGVAAVKAQRAALQQEPPALFTIGYEGLKFETYLNRLIKNNVRLLCDVRQNPLSRKYGFSKPMLAQVLPKFKIDYAHIPELGIISAKRKGLEDEVDFAALFSEYRKELPTRTKGLAELDRLIKQHGRVALTCFEAHHKSCHRHCVSDFLTTRDKCKVVHL